MLLNCILFWFILRLGVLGVLMMFGWLVMIGIVFFMVLSVFVIDWFILMKVVEDVDKEWVIVSFVIKLLIVI